VTRGQRFAHARAWLVLGPLLLLVLAAALYVRASGDAAVAPEAAGEARR
jgi:hypothetical protein